MDSGQSKGATLAQVPPTQGGGGGGAACLPPSRAERSSLLHAVNKLSCMMSLTHWRAPPLRQAQVANQGCRCVVASAANHRARRVAYRPCKMGDAGAESLVAMCGSVTRGESIALQYTHCEAAAAARHACKL